MLYSTCYFPARFVDGQIEMEPLEHTAMEEELNKPEYGKHTRAVMHQDCMYIH